MRLIYLDGEFVHREQARVSVFDHGYLYGDGVFEGIRAYNGRVFRLDEHLTRLYASARSIMLSIPRSQAEMREAVLETLRRNDLWDGYIRLVVSRGPGDLGLDPRKCQAATVVIIAETIRLYPEEAYTRGLRAITATTRKIRSDMMSPQVKSLNYLNNILARIEVNQAGADEGIMLNTDGYVTECTADNVFIVRRGILWTPPPYAGILEGITRDAVLDLARRLKVPAAERVFTMHDVYVAEECFLTGTAAEVAPVVEVDGRTIGDGTPGVVTKRLMTAFRDLVRTEGAPIYAQELPARMGSDAA
jgi:branched-chain amino acid aminotransferase